MRTFFEPYTGLEKASKHIALNLFWTTGYHFAINPLSVQKNLLQDTLKFSVGGSKYGSEFFF